jgi:hypothetical protein
MKKFSPTASIFTKVILSQKMLLKDLNQVNCFAQMMELLKQNRKSTPRECMQPLTMLHRDLIWF